MAEAGMIAPAYKNAAHYIVMSNPKDLRMVELLLKMAEFYLHFNDFYNGVFLPTTSKNFFQMQLVQPIAKYTLIFKNKMYTID
ncbi:hypothetical protein ACMGGR_18175 [Erwinia sp. BNK-24-b]|uniref:hypothetical protein n=1 Tax=Erwinia TaxID=551 RepID=UPI001FEF44F9|nr:hypothetical protein [Erwinia phyllosphaerae]MBV4369221.1 hypothetical protein [Erwinia phyllosphaerae]